MRILVTGFDPFGKETINPAWEAVKRLPDTIHETEIIKREIPTVRFASLKTIEEAIKEYNPDMILSVGQAGGRKDITVERIGINCDHYRITDNQGNKPQEEKIREDGPDAYFVTLPIQKMVAAIRKEGIPASISNTAGTFVCNHVIYGTRHLCATQYPDIASGFIHVPYLPEQVTDKPGVPSMKLEDIITALQAALTAMIKYKEEQ